MGCCTYDFEHHDRREQLRSGSCSLASGASCSAGLGPPCNLIQTNGRALGQPGMDRTDMQPWARPRWRSCRPWLLFMFLAGLSFATVSAQADLPMTGLPCDQSGMCSLQHAKFWTGDIKESGSLRSMLEAVTFKKELILTCITGYDTARWIDPIAQLHSEVNSFGFGHFIVLTTQKSSCDALHAAVPNLSCAWDSMELAWESQHGSTHVWFLRWKLFARAGRLGYNLMNVDADFIFFRDPYPVIKSKPMSDLQMWCNPEGGAPMHCNGGFNYIQNLRPDGPVAWALRAIVDDQLWAMDDKWAYTLSQPGGRTNCHSLDQDMMFDGIKSAYVGRPLHYDVVSDCRNDQWSAQTRLGTRLNRTQVLDNIKMLYHGETEDNLKNQTHVRPPTGWMPEGFALTDTDTRQWVSRLTVPNMAYGWPEELGGRAGPEQRGSYTATWLATLKSDCPDCPWWNDHRPIKGGRDELEVALGPRMDGEGGKYVRERFWDQNVPVELIGVGPAWLSNSLVSHRTGMWTGPGSGLPHPFASTHIHYWAQQNAEHKPTIRKVIGRYNWSLAARLSPDGSTAFASRHTPTRLLALHPDIDLRRTRSMGEFNSIVLGLMQVALMTHRTPVLPDVPCEAPWLHDAWKHGQVACTAPMHSVIRHSLPQLLSYPVDEQGNLVGGWVRAQGEAGTSAPVKSAEEQGRFWREHHRFRVAMGYLWDMPCVRDIGKPGAVIQSEFAHWQASQPQGSAHTTPSADNTVLLLPAGKSPELELLAHDGPLDVPGQVLKPSEAKGWSVADIQVLLPLGQVAREISRRAETPLLYLGHPIALLTSGARAARGDRHLHGSSSSAQPGAAEGNAARQLLQQGATAGKGATGARGAEGAEGPMEVGSYGVVEADGIRRRLRSGEEQGGQGRGERHTMINVEALNSALEAVNQRLESSRCRVMMADGEDHSKRLSLQFSQTRLGMLQNGRLQVFA